MEELKMINEFKTIEEKYSYIKQIECNKQTCQLDLMYECSKQNYNMNKIILLVQLVDDINYQLKKTDNNNTNYYKDYQFKYDNNIIYLAEYGDSVLHTALKHNNIKVVKYLVEHGANVNLQNNKGNTALHLASDIQDNTDVIKYLVEQGADVNLQNNNDHTALFYASTKNNNLKVIKYLVEQGANINFTNSSALHYACNRTNNLEVVKYLVEHGADVNMQNCIGDTPLDNAYNIKNNLEVVRYLRANGAKYSFLGFKY